MRSPRSSVHTAPPDAAPCPSSKPMASTRKPRPRPAPAVSTSEPDSCDDATPRDRPPSAPSRGCPSRDQCRRTAAPRRRCGWRGAVWAPPAQRRARARASQSGRRAASASTPPAASAARHGDRVEHLGDLLLGQDASSRAQLEDAAAGLHRLGGELGGALVADHRIERGDGADAVVDVVRGRRRGWR